MSCDHNIETEEWVEDPDLDLYEGGPYSCNGRWETRVESSTVDLDLHRWKCTQCGHIGSYGGNY